MEATYSTPDKGYAYVILFASFLGHVLQYGVVWTVGVFYAIFVEIFPNNSGTVALISSLNTAFYYGAGPLSSFLTNKYGPRVVSVFGGLLGSMGLIFSMYATNIYALYATFGVITGFGLGLAYIPIVTTVGLYFEKYRSLAIGAAVSGCGIGTFIFPPIIRYFIHHYGWRGALLLVGGITLNMCVCGALLRPFKVGDGEEEGNNNKTDDNKQQQQPNQEVKQKYEMTNSKLSLNNLRVTALQQSLLKPAGSKSNMLYRSEPEMRERLLRDGMSNSKLSVNTISSISRPYPESVIKNADSNISLFLTTSTNVIDYETVPEKSSVLNLFIFKNIHYLILCLNNFGVCFGLSIVYVHLAAYATSNGVDEDKSALLFSVIGIANFFGRIAFGAIGYIPCVDHTGLYTMAFVISGITTVICPFYKSYLWFFCYAAAFGFSTGGFGALLPQVVIQILEVQYLTSGYGYLLIFEAMGTLLGAPVAGWLYEWSGIYENSLYLGGCVIVLSSIIMVYTWLCRSKQCCIKQPEQQQYKCEIQVEEAS